jgi:hypothetical protein
VESETGRRFDTTRSRVFFIPLTPLSRLQEMLKKSCGRNAGGIRGDNEKEIRGIFVAFSDAERYPRNEPGPQI